jgi:hypothetical protein
MTVNKLGGRPLEGLAMQKIDPAFLFEMGDQLRKVATISRDTPPADAYFIMQPAAETIERVVNQSVYWHLVRNPCKAAANALVQHMRTLSASILEYPDLATAKLELVPVLQLQQLYGKFETLFLGDLQGGSLYLVSPKGAYDTDALTEGGLLAFSADLATKVPEAAADLKQATRCIAFELPTAAGFHLHRAHESVLRVYWDNVTGGAERPKDNNMGNYLRELEKLNKGREEVRSHLKSIKDFHRNPLMHPEQSLESIDQALDLLSAIRCSIGYMLQEIQGPSVPLLDQLLADAAKAGIEVQQS